MEMKIIGARVRRILFLCFTALFLVSVMATFFVPFAGIAGSVTDEASQAEEEDGKDGVQSDAYASYDEGTKTVRMGTDLVTREIVFLNGGYYTTLLRDVKGKVDYVTSAEPQSEFVIGKEGGEQTSETGEWRYISSEKQTLSQGELEFSVSLTDGEIYIKKHYVIYPHTSIIQEWCEITNSSSSALSVSVPGMFTGNWKIDGKNSVFYYMTGNGNYSGAAILKGTSLTKAYNRTFDSLNDSPEVQTVHGHYQDNLANKIMGVGLYNEFFAVHNEETENGAFILFDYIGAWTNEVSYADDRITFDGRVQMENKMLASGESLTTPKSLVGFWTGDIDDMGNTINHYQADYKWDYTNDAARTSRSTQWIIGQQTDNAFELAQLARRVGGGSIHIDDSWFDAAGDWNETNGDDFRAINEFVKKSGGPGITVWSPVWMTYYQSDIALAHPDWVVEEGNHGGYIGSGGGYGSHLNFALEEVYQFALAKLGELQERWGSYMWRYDAEAVSLVDGSTNDMLAQSNNFYRLLKEFKDLYPEAAIHGCSSGGHSMTVESLRYSDIQQVTDGGVGTLGNYYLSLLFPSAKLQAGDILTGFTDPWYRKNLAFTHETGPNSARDVIPDAGYSESELEIVREYLEMYDYLTEKGVKSKDSWYYRPLTSTGEGAEYLFQQMDETRQKGAIYITEWTEKVGKEITVMPKGLIEDCVYTVSSWNGGVQTVTKTGAELMEQGITISALTPGETIFLNLEDRPGTGRDTEAPGAPSELTICESTYLGRTGVEINWTAAVDDNAVSYYNVYRNGTAVDKVAYGTFYFGLSGNIYDEWEISAVDRDGNESARVSISASGSPDTYEYDFTGDFSSEQGNRGWSYSESSYGTKMNSSWNESGKYWTVSGGGLLKKDSVVVGLNDTVIEWKAPRAGYVRIYGQISKYRSSLGGDGIELTLLHNSSEIYSGSLGGDNYDGIAYNRSVWVDAGSKIVFNLSSGGNAISDKIHFSAGIRYEGGTENIPLEEVTFAGEDSLELAIGKTTRLGVNLYPVDTTETDLVYEFVSGQEYARLDSETGEITPLAAGEAVVKVSSAQDPSLSDTIQLTFIDELKVFDSAKDFSSVQGYRNWTYLCFPNNNISSLTEAVWNTSSQLWSGTESYMEVTTQTMHPGTGTTIARMFTAPYDGTIDIINVLHMVSANGNGTLATIYINGAEYRNYVVSGTKESEKRLKDIVVKQGDQILFAVNANGSNAYDSTYWTIRIVYKNDVETENLTQSVQIKADSGVLSVGDSLRLSVQTEPASSSEILRWSVVSGDEYIIFDEKTLTVYGMAAGTVILQAIPTDGSAVSSIITLQVVDPQNRFVSDSISGFSSEQGKNGWYYLKSTQPGTYTQMSNYVSGEWTSENWMKISATQMHPQNGFDAVRGYRVEYTGKLSMTGRIRKTAEGLGGNGVMLYIYVNNDLVWSSFLGANDAIGISYNVSVNVKEGDFVYLHLNANGNDSYDATEWVQLNKYSGVTDVAKSTEARRIDERIADLPLGRLTMEYKPVVDALWNAYAALSESDRKSIEGYARLVAAKNEADALAENFAASQAADEAIGLAVYSGNRELLLIARSVYDSLSDAQKALVTKLADLERAESLMPEENKELGDLIARIAAFNPQAITVLDADSVAELRQEADRLNEAGISLPEEAAAALQALENALKTIGRWA